jgi:hypothetical protein
VQYRIRARLDVDTHQIEATETIDWRNNGSRAVEKLPLHLYMNAFKNEETVFMREHRDDGGNNPERWGWIEIQALTLDGADRLAAVRPSGPDETLVELQFPAPIPPQGAVHLELRFKVQLPDLVARTGYRDGFHMVGQWFPKPAALTGPPGEEIFEARPFHALSEFYADFGLFDVELDVPDTFVVDATGVLVEARDLPDDRRLLRYRAEDVHDFAWFADPYLLRRSQSADTELGPVAVALYYRAENDDYADRHLQAAVGAIEGFSRLLLPYPWARIVVLDTPHAAAEDAGAMEYPTLVTTNGDGWLALEGIRTPEQVTIHEVGHNWFQGMLANNEVEEAWLDEGVNEYADAIVMGEIYGHASSLLDWGGYQAEYLALLRGGQSFVKPSPDPIARPSYQVVDDASYMINTYVRPALALKTLENLFGARRFHAAMRDYARRFAFRHPTGRDFFLALEKSLGEDLDWFARPVFQQSGFTRYRVRTAQCRPRHEPRGIFGSGAARRSVGSDHDTDEDELGDDASRPLGCKVVVENLGDLAVPVDIEIEFADETRLATHWDGRGGWHRFDLERTSPVRAVYIDPEQRNLLDTHPAENSVRVAPELGPCRRAAARAQFWTQTVIQAFGL